MLRYQYNRIANIILAWVLAGFVLTFYDHFLFLSHLSAGHTEVYTLGSSLLANLGAGFIGGLFGSVTLITLNHRFRHRPYYHSLIVVVIAFILIVAFIANLIAMIETDMTYGTLRGEEAQAFYKSRIFTTFHLKNIIFWAFVVAFTHFTIQVSDKFGPGNLWKIITGQYHSPKEENRIFMFLDLKSSTTIAERLGDHRYHEFLREVFSDLTTAIIRHKAEIYQYVGDEVILCWTINPSNPTSECLRCFFEIKQTLEKRIPYYKKEYENIPQFKAGAHYGNVVVGEVGDLKREITYSGDVLNTTARIQGQCNALESPMLISDKLRKYLLPDTEAWDIKSKGVIPLKGKENDLELYSVNVK